MLEAVGIPVDEVLLAGWRERVGRARSRLGWRDSALVARVHAGGASLALAAPCDQLFVATEVNEWALCATLQQRDAAHWTDLPAAMLVGALEDAADPATVVPPVLEEHAAMARLTLLAAREARPALVSLLAASARHALPHLLDDDALTLGAGAGARTYPLDALPAPEAVPWQDLHGIPTAVVTGSNGKTTTVRLLAACARAHGWRAGYNCTDGVFIGDEPVASGDYSGPAGTRRVMRDSRTEAAVLETARGGILRRGIAVSRADVAIVTNVSTDHFGEYGIDDLGGLADAKLTVAALLDSNGVLVLNADDKLLREKAAELPRRLGSPCMPRLAWFALDADAPALRAWRERGASTAGVRAGRMIMETGGAQHDLGPIAPMPLAIGGTAAYNIANLAAASLAAQALGIAPATIAKVFAQFGANPGDNPGRMMRFDLGGVQVLMDYAHNPEGLRGFLGVAQQLRGPGGRLAVLLGHAGNRRDEDIEQVSQVVAEFQPELVVVKEIATHLRGREPGELPRLIRSALLRADVPAHAIEMRDSEPAAAACALDWARPGDVVGLLVHAPAGRAEVLAMLEARMQGTAPAV
ncbi:MAG: Mur ligase family protein [Steroidobacteraceae bacterium]